MVDTALIEELARDHKSAVAMTRLAKTGATLVLVADPAGEKSIRIVEVATGDELGNWWFQD